MTWGCYGDSVKCLSYNKHYISICEIKTFLQKTTLRAEEFQPPMRKQMPLHFLLPLTG